jgi:hypothetical protein
MNHSSASDSSAYESAPPHDVDGFPATMRGDGLIPAELCLGLHWGEPNGTFYARFVSLPRIGEAIRLPNREGPVYRVTDIRHHSASPGGAAARVRLLCMPEDEDAGSGQNAPVR